MTTTPPKIADVAAAAGVSTGTVSLALNGKGRVSAETREKVRRVAKELNYRPDVRARRLRGGRSNTIALVTTVPGDVVGGESNLSFLLGLALPLSRVLLDRGYSMLLLPPAPDEEQLDRIDVDGVVLVDPREDEVLCVRLRQRGIVVVSVGDVAGLAADGIVDRGFSGADVAVSHLVDRGAERIAVLTGDGGNSVSAGVRAFVGVEEHPADVRIQVIDASDEAGESGGYEIACELLGADPGERPDAVYAPTDAVAVGVVHAADDLGLSIPADLMVVTNFDGPRAQVSRPPLTALDLDLSGIAEAAADLVVACMEAEGKAGLGAVTEEPRRISAPRPRPVVRASTEFPVRD
jgi:DNA-binding LacI/PurR family transcriptional regulator